MKSIRDKRRMFYGERKIYLFHFSWSIKPFMADLRNHRSGNLHPYIIWRKNRKFHCSFQQFTVSSNTILCSEAFHFLLKHSIIFSNILLFNFFPYSSIPLVFSDRQYAASCSFIIMQHWRLKHCHLNVPITEKNIPFSWKNVTWVALFAHQQSAKGLQIGRIVSDIDLKWEVLT